MATTLKFLPGSTIRWRATRFIVVDYADIDAIIARELGKRKLERIPVRDAKPDRTPGDQKAWTPDLVSIPAEAWKRAVTRFQVLKPLLEMDRAKRTFEKVQKVANALGRHPATIYRWMEAYERSERISVFLRKDRSDRGKSRLSKKVNAIIEAAIKKIYLKAERPDVAAVVEEVRLQCFKSKIKKQPDPDTIRQRVAALPDRLKLDKREGRKAAAEKYEPTRGHFPGADFPLAVAQIDHTPMDVIVVDEEHRRPIQRPSLTVVIDVCSRMVLGFAIYLEETKRLHSRPRNCACCIAKGGLARGRGCAGRVALLGKNAHNPLRQCKGVPRHSDRARVPGSQYYRRPPPATRTSLWRPHRTRIPDMADAGSSAQGYDVFQCRTEGRL